MPLPPRRHRQPIPECYERVGELWRDAIIAFLRREGELSLRELAERLHLSHGAVNHHVCCLERGGLVASDYRLGAAHRPERFLRARQRR